MRWVIGGLALLLVGCTQAVVIEPVGEWPVPLIDYDEIGVRGVIQWVAHWVAYQHDDGEFWQTPLETYESHRGDCEDYSILALYLIHRDLGVDGSLILGRGHAWIRVYGEDWDVQPALQRTPRYEVLWMAPWSEVPRMIEDRR